MNDHDYLPLSEACKPFQRSSATLKRWIKKEQAPHKKGDKGEYLVCVSELRTWRALRQERKSQARLQAGRDAAADLLPARIDVPVAKLVEGERKPDRVALAREFGSPGGTPEPKRRRPGDDRLTPTSATDRTAVPVPVPDPDLAELRRADETNRILASAKSVVVRRVPSADGDEALWGAEGLEPYVSFTEAELRAAVCNGGLKIMIQARLGPGVYVAEAIGSGGAPYPPVEITIPSLVHALHEIQAAEKSQRLKEEAERKEAGRQRKAAEVAAKRQRRAEQEQATHLRLFHEWSGEVASVAVYEAMQRLRYREAQIQSELQALAKTHVRALAAQGSEARALAAKIRDMLRERARLVTDLNRLRAARRLPELDPVDVVSDIDEPSVAFARPADPIDPSSLEPLQAELQQVRSWDPGLFRDDVFDLLEEREPTLGGLPTWHPRLQAELEHLLPPPFPGFFPWSHSCPPAPAPGPGPVPYHRPVHPR